MSLPFELLCRTFCFLEADDLKQCKLVCKTWCYPATSRFYNKITIGKNSNLECLTRCLSSFGHLVQHVHFDLPDDDSEFESKQKLMHRIFRRCPNIQHISSIKEAEHLVLKTLHIFRKVLNLKNLATIPATNFEIDPFYRKCILIHGESITRFFTGELQDLPRLPRLEDLNITKKSISMDEIACILKSYTQLKYLSLQMESFVNMPLVPAHTIPHYPALKSLAVAIPTDINFSFNGLNKLLSHVPQLESLNINVNNNTASVLNNPASLQALSLTIKRLCHLKEARLISRRPGWSNKIFDEAIDFAYIDNISKWVAQPDPGWSTSISFLIDSTSMQGNGIMRDSITYVMSRKSKQQCVQLRALPVYDREIQINRYIKSFAHVATSLHVDFQSASFAVHDLGYLFPLLEEFKKMEKLTIVGGHYNDPLPDQLSVPSVRELCLKNFDCSAANSVHDICNIFSNLETLSLQYNIHCESMLSPELVNMPGTRLKKVYIDMIDVQEERLSDFTTFNNHETKKSTYNISLRLAKTKLHFRYYRTPKPFVELIQNSKPSNKLDIFDLSMEFHDIDTLLFRCDGNLHYSWCKSLA